MVSCLCFVSFRHFWGMKIRFLNSHVTLGSRLCDYRWAILDILMPWKCHSVEFWDPVYMGTWFILKTFIALWLPEMRLLNSKWDSSRFMKLLVGEYSAFVEHLFVILAIFTVSLNPPIEAPCLMSTTAPHFGNTKRFKRASDKRYCAIVTLIFSILKAWKCES